MKSNDRIDESILQRIGHVKIMEMCKIAKTAYVRVCADIRSVVRPRKRWTDTVKKCKKKKKKRFGCQASKENDI